MNVLRHQRIETGEIASHAGFRQSQRHSRSDIRNARSVRLYADGEIFRNTVVAKSAEPGQPVTDLIHDPLVLARDSLPVLPAGQRRHAIRELRHHLRREYRTITAI